MVDPMLDPALLAPERVRPLKRREYERLVELGVFEDERIELLRGVLVEMSPQGEPHSMISAWFAQRLIRALHPQRFETRSHSPFAASADSMPEPDVSVSIPRADFKHPGPRDALLLIEVSGSSIVKDRVIKTEIYAAAGVPEYWIVNLRSKTIDVLTRPTKAGYKRIVQKSIGDVLRPVKLRSFTLRVGDVPWRSEDEAPPKKRRVARKR